MLVIKNNSLGQIRWEQMVFLGNPEYGVELQPIDFAAFARACGASGFTIEDPNDRGRILDEALDTQGPVVVEALVDPFEPPRRPTRKPLSVGGWLLEPPRNTSRWRDYPEIEFKENQMKTKLLHQDGEKTFAIIFDEGEEFMQGLRSFAEGEHMTAARFTAIGAFSRATLGFFDADRREYIKIPVNEQVEALTLVGDIATKEEALTTMGDIAIKENEVEVHAHVVLGKADGSAMGGHIMEAYVRPTLEVMLIESPSYLHRKFDEKSGLALISL